MNRNITQVVEDAAWRYIRGNLPSWLPDGQVYRGIENIDVDTDEGDESSLKRLPCVTAICEDATYDGTLRGNPTANLEIVVESSRAKTTSSDHDASAEAVFDLFYSEDAPRLLAEASGAFFCSDLAPAGTGMRADGGRFVSYARFYVRHACAQRLD